MSANKYDYSMVELTNWFGSQNIDDSRKRFQDIQNRDKLKKQLCEQNDVKLFYINYDDNIVEKTNYILETILKDS